MQPQQSPEILQSASELQLSPTSAGSQRSTSPVVVPVVEVASVVWDVVEEEVVEEEVVEEEVVEEEDDEDDEDKEEEPSEPLELAVSGEPEDDDEPPFVVDVLPVLIVELDVTVELAVEPPLPEQAVSAALSKSAVPRLGAGCRYMPARVALARAANFLPQQKRSSSRRSSL